PSPSFTIRRTCPPICAKCMSATTRSLSGYISVAASVMTRSAWRSCSSSIHAWWQGLRRTSPCGGKCAHEHRYPTSLLEPNALSALGRAIKADIQLRRECQQNWQLRLQTRWRVAVKVQAFIQSIEGHPTTLSQLQRACEWVKPEGFLGLYAY